MLNFTCQVNLQRSAQESLWRGDKQHTACVCRRLGQHYVTWGQAPEEQGVVT